MRMYPAFRGLSHRHDLLSLRDPQGMSISPDGKHIAFVVGQAIGETNSYRSGLFVVATDRRSRLFGRSAARDRRIGTTSISGFQKLRSGPTTATLLVTACASRLASIGRCGVGTQAPVKGNKSRMSTGTSKSIDGLAMGGHSSWRSCFSGTSRRRLSGRSTEFSMDRDITPYLSIPVLAQKAESQEPKREYWVHEYETNIERRATAKRNSRLVSTGDLRRERITRREARPSLREISDSGRESVARRKAVAYLYMVDDPSLSPTWARRLLIRLTRKRRIRGGDARQPLRRPVLVEHGWGDAVLHGATGAWKRSPRLHSVVGNRSAPTARLQSRPRRISSLRFHRIRRGDTSPVSGRTTLLRRRSRFLTPLPQRSRSLSI